MKLFTRYNRIIVLIMILIFLLSSIFYYFFIYYIMIGEVDSELNYRKSKMERFARLNKALPVSDRMGDVQVTFNPSDKTSANIEYALIKLYDSAENTIGTFRKMVFILPIGKKFYQVTLVRPLEGTKRLSLTLLFGTLSTILIIIVTSLLINRTLLQKLWQPFYETISAMRRYKLGKVKEVILPPTKIEEFAFLNQNLQDTIQKAEADYRSLKEFTDNASHELQTPLALIRSKLDLLIQREELSHEQSEELKEIYTAVKRLSRLSSSLLLLTKIDNQQFEQLSTINLKEKIEEKVQQFQELWKNNQIKLQCHLKDSFIRVNSDLMDILLNNLLSNASRHNTEDGEIEINLEQNLLQISNSGTAKTLDPSRIFRRFYKEKSNSDHNGLGLSIIKQICDQSDIQISYSYVPGKHIFQLEWL